MPTQPPSPEKRDLFLANAQLIDRGTGEVVVDYEKDPARLAALHQLFDDMYTIPPGCVVHEDGKIY